MYVTTIQMYFIDSYPTSEDIKKKKRKKKKRRRLLLNCLKWAAIRVSVKERGILFGIHLFCDIYFFSCWVPGSWRKEKGTRLPRREKAMRIGNKFYSVSAKISCYCLKQTARPVLLANLVINFHIAHLQTENLLITRSFLTILRSRARGWVRPKRKLRMQLRFISDCAQYRQPTSFTFWPHMLGGNSPEKYKSLWSKYKCPWQWSIDGLIPH